VSVRVKNKRKIINDPVHGFVTIPTDFIFDLIEHRYFQRLRRIKQLGLTHYVYPGATHTRFQHTIGALHLMTLALECMKSKGIQISSEEEEAVLIAILLHDIGHGPFSHALERSIITGISHEQISHLLMDNLNREFPKKLNMAIAVFDNRYAKKFLHQLVASQLDMDRLDYIMRDSFYTGVTEGTIGTDRIIKMLAVENDTLVVEKKGIYSIEKFLIARRLMYWQVYLHKTVIASENLLVRLLQRAKYLAEQNIKVYATPSLEYFLFNKVNKKMLEQKTAEVVEYFTRLDDSDILASAKEWQFHPDKVLSLMAADLVNRKLPAVEIGEKPYSPEIIERIKRELIAKYSLYTDDARFMVSSGELSNSAFSSHENMIQILTGQNETRDISEISDILNVPYLNKSEKKYFICYPKEFRE
jgi:uncharacterized protein